MTANDTKAKLLELDAMAERIDQLRAGGKRCVLCVGTFDLIHPGHFRFLDAAKAEGDILAVVVTADRFVDKGPGRPVYNERLRAESLAALAAVDLVAVGTSPSAADSILSVKPDVFVRGTSGKHGLGVDEVGTIDEERTAIEDVGGRLVVTDDIAFSSTQLLNSYFEVLTPEARAYLKRFKETHSLDTIVQGLEAASTLKVLVVGDCIIDEYHVCNVIGRSSKSPALNARFLYSESHAGGSLAVANHIAGYSDSVHLLSCIGANDDRRDFLESHLADTVSHKLFSRPDGPTTVKRRYTTPYSYRMVFGLTFIEDKPLPEETAREFNAHLESIIGEYDLVVVTDFGHGLINDECVQILTNNARFLALNVQTNSANTGYNLLTKYPRADYISVDKEEMRLAYHDRFGDLRSLVSKAASDMKASAITVTLGARGALTWSADSGWADTPAFSTEVLDAVGAGDAFLSVSALAAMAGQHADAVGFVGNSAAALAIRILGNRETVEPDRLYRLMRSLLT